MQNLQRGFWWLVLSFSIHLRFSLQQDSDVKAQNLCRRWGHQTCVIDDRLYLDGGLISSQPDFASDNIQSNTKLMYEDFSDSAAFFQHFPIQYNNLSKSNQVPSLEGGILWPDSVNKVFYLYGGRSPDGKLPYPFDLWKYDTIGDNWTIVDGGAGNTSRAYYGAGVTIEDRGWSYYLGGWLGNASVPGWTGPALALNSMVKYDMIENTWRNYTIPGAPAKAEGALLYIPASDEGMLVYFGGLEIASNGSSTMASLDQIHLFDIAAETWYTQTSTGNIPQPRRKFCAVAVWPKDRSSYDIYLYGGLDQSGNGWPDVYALTLPSFQWVFVYPNETSTASWKGKGMSSCDVLFDSEMLVIGGIAERNSSLNCDSPDIANQHDLQLNLAGDSTLWLAPLPTKTEYRVPPAITAVIGGGPLGNATMTSPANGWAKSDLPVYFGRLYASTVRSPTRSLPSPTSTKTGIVSHSKTTNVGAIAGGVVGGAIVLIVSVGLIACYCIRRRKRQQVSGQGTQPSITHEGPPVFHPGGFITAYNHAQSSPSVTTPGSQLPRGSPPPPWFQTFPPIPSPQENKWQPAIPQPTDQQRNDNETQESLSLYLQRAPLPDIPQTYYPPPPEPQLLDEAQAIHEMPENRSPVQLGGIPSELASKVDRTV